MMQFHSRCLFLLPVVAPWLPVPTVVADELPRRLDAAVSEDYAYLQSLYEHLHANPELSFLEQRTSERIADELRDAGYTVTTGVGGHGVVGVLKNGSGPVVLIRTDLDALPVAEKTGLPYASKIVAKNERGEEVPVMHACGHDIHMTVFAGTARQLARMKTTWRGTLVLIGQPAEERGAGARAMLADGLFTRFPRPDYAIALHVDASRPAGILSYCKGFALANVDAVDIVIRGVGGHGAYPHTTKDPIVMAAQLVLALQTIVSREIKPIEPAVVTVGSIHGGTKHNVIADEVRLQLTLRSYSDTVREQTIAAIRRMAHGIAVTAGVPKDRMPIVTVKDEYTPATYNDPELTERLAAAVKPVLGTDNVIEAEPVMGGEDFGQYGRQEPRVPICIFWLGSVAKSVYDEHQRSGEPLPSLHSSQYAPDPEPTIKTGVKAMTTAALELLGG